MYGDGIALPIPVHLPALLAKQEVRRPGGSAAGSRQGSARSISAARSGAGSRQGSSRSVLGGGNSLDGTGQRSGAGSRHGSSRSLTGASAVISSAINGADRSAASSRQGSARWPGSVTRSSRASSTRSSRASSPRRES